MTEIIESYIIEHKLYVTNKFLSAYFKTDVRNIRNWTKKGLSSHKMVGIKHNLFILDEVIEWKDININITKSKASSKNKEVSLSGDEDDLVEQIDDIQGKIKQANQMLQLKGNTKSTHDEADRISKIMDALIKAVKLGEQTKELIPKKDTEKVIVEFIATLIAGYKRDIKILPKECANRKESEIRDILENTYKTNIEKLQKMTKIEMLSTYRFFDVIEEVLNLILDDIEIDDIINKLKD